MVFPLVSLWVLLVCPVLLILYISMSHSYHWFDQPDEDRKLHSTSVPTSGGLVFMLPALIFLFYFPFLQNGYTLYLASGLLILLIVGGIDDFKGITVRFRLLIISSIALGLLLYVFQSEITNTFVIAIFFLGIIWWMNLFNFMDGADGLAALHAIITTLGYLLAFILLSQGYSNMVQYLVVFLLCLMSFLFFNFPSARVFMGDSGSLSVSFLLAFIALYGIVNNVFDEILVISFHLSFIVDATLTLFARLIFGHKISQSHNLHLFQSLVKKLKSHYKVSSLYAFVSICNVSIALFVQFIQLDLIYRMSILLLQSLVLCFFWFNFYQKTKFERFRK